MDDARQRRRRFVVPIQYPVVDLTGSDDEEGPTLMYPASNSFGRSTRVADGLISNHGLVANSSFTAGSTASSVSKLPNLPNSSASPKNPAESRKLPILPYSGSDPKNPVERRKLPNILNSWADPKHPAKRRRLDDDMSSSGVVESNGKYKGNNSTYLLRASSVKHRDQANHPSAFVTTKQKICEIQRRKSNNDRLKTFLQERVVPLIQTIVDRYNFDVEAAKIARRETLTKVFDHEGLRQEVEENSGRLSKSAWNTLQSRAEVLVANVALRHGVLTQGHKLPHYELLASRKSLTSSMSRNSTPSKTSNPIDKSYKTAGRPAERTLISESRLRPKNMNSAHPVLVSTAEAKKKAFSEKMRVIMNRRWARGEMTAVVERRKENKLAHTAVLVLDSRPSYTHTPKSIVSAPIPPRNDGHHTSGPHFRKGVLSSAVKSQRQTTSLPDDRIYDAAPVLMVPTDSSQDSDSDSDEKNARCRRNSSSPATSFSLEGGSDDLATESKAKDHVVDRRSGRFFHMRTPSMTRPLVRLPVQSRTTARPLRSKGLAGSRERKESARNLVVIRERDSLLYAGLERTLERPYLSMQHQSDMERGLSLLGSDGSASGQALREEVIELQGVVVHVDFCDYEILKLIQAIEKVADIRTTWPTSDPKNQIQHLLSRRKILSELISAIHTPSQHFLIIPGRTKKSIVAFLRDAARGVISDQASIVQLNASSSVSRVSEEQDSILSALMDRETIGRRCITQYNIPPRARLIAAIEDSLTREVEWTDCAGDIATVTWLPDNGFICGTVTHSDQHNQQYNKPGNLMIGSCASKSLQSIAGHRITRPIVEKGDNSRPSMRETQDPWLYTSVTSTAYSIKHNKCFTGSFDNTVKIWEVSADKTSVDICGTWPHEGHVNFVVTSPKHEMIATATDVRDGAIRVYTFQAENPSSSEFSTHSGEYARKPTDNWAYFPATIQWGQSLNVSHLLLVGYSPRSFDPHEEVPEDKANTGELCLWNMFDGIRIPITSARTQNVFEVVWHPSQPMFVAATSPTGAFDDGVHTQLRIFGQTELGSFSHMTTLDCGAVDINEITIMPNSQVKCYVTASCTDGCTYVWDSARGDQAIHILRHGESIDDQVQDGDNGVKFAAWGKSADRFYTGSSDGVVKCWNPRAAADAVFVRDIANLSGGISAGAFSPDFERLLIGDATGKVHLFSLDDTEPGEERPAVIRKQLTPHSQPSPPVNGHDADFDVEKTAVEIARDFVTSGQIVINEDEYVGAVQGPSYANTGLFAPQLHKHNDVNKRVRRTFRKVQELRYQHERASIARLRALSPSDLHKHQLNVAKDLNLADLEDTDGLDLNFSYNDFNLELAPGSSLFGVDNDEEGSDEEPLLECEIQVFTHLKKQILQEITVQRGLDFVSKELT